MWVGTLQVIWGSKRYQSALPFIRSFRCSWIIECKQAIIKNADGITDGDCIAFEQAFCNDIAKVCIADYEDTNIS